MKRFLFAMALAAASVPAFAADVGVSVSVGPPGFYGRIDIGNAPQPRLIYKVMAKGEIEMTRAMARARATETTDRANSPDRSQMRHLPGLMYASEQNIAIGRRISLLPTDGISAG